MVIRMTPYPASTAATREELEQLLWDDVPHGDLTTEALGIAALAGRMAFVARDPMVVALVEDAAAIIELAGCRVAVQARSGMSLGKGDAILSATGPAGGLLRSWKVAQTLIEVWSGVATGAHAIVAAARAASPNVVVACTRKNTPGTKTFAVAAVRVGGAVMHRLGLSETILVFPEHQRFLDNEPLDEVAARLRRSAPEKKLAIEVTTVETALEAARAGFDIIQAEKFSEADIATLAEALTALLPRPLIAAAGGINARNAAAYAQAGADVLVTSAPYSERPHDVQVRFQRDVVA
jgi:molybdenum transport protein